MTIGFDQTKTAKANPNERVVSRTTLTQDAVDGFLRGQKRYGFALRGLSRTRALFADAQKEWEKRRGGKHICRYDDACCEHRTPQVIDIEAQDIVERWLGLPMEDRFTMERQLDTWIHRPLETEDAAGVAAQVGEALHRGCPFYLSDERRCGIEDYRPLQCRAYGMFNAPQDACTAPLAGSETAESRHLFVRSKILVEDIVAHVQNTLIAFIGFLQSISDVNAGYIPQVGGLLPWLVYQKLRGGAGDEVSAGMISKPLSAFMTAPPFLRWAEAAVQEHSITRLPEDVDLQQQGLPARWKQPISGMPAIGRKPFGTARNTRPV